jgi:hypothetical protein
LDDKKTKISKTIFATEATEATEILRLKKRMETSLYGRGYPPTKACLYPFQLLYLCALCDLGG